METATKLFAQRFEIIRTYEGGMGEVLICRDHFNGRLIAAKTANTQPDRFNREVRIWIALGQHEHIVRAHVLYYVDHQPYVFCDFLGTENGTSRTLQSVANLQAPSMDLVVAAGLAVVRALKHAQSIFPDFVHRDIKPSNLLLDSNGICKLNDFGIGRIRPATVQAAPGKETQERLVSGMGASLPRAGDKQTFVTRLGEIVGTLGYIAPEQAIQPQLVSSKSDLYSLGVVLFELLLGRIPNYEERIHFPSEKWCSGECKAWALRSTAGPCMFVGR